MPSNLPFCSDPDNYCQQIERYRQFVCDQHCIAKKTPTEPGALILEAVAFEIFSKHLNFNMKIGETEKGGPDFICEKQGQKISLEVTHLNTDSIGERTGLFNSVFSNTEVYSGVFYEPDFRKICDAIENKAQQLKKQSFPGVVLLGSFHSQSNVLLGPVAAKYALIRFVSDDGLNFLMPEEISAVLFAAVDPVQVYVHGILHPTPERQLNEVLFGDIPFGRFVEQSHSLGNNINRTFKRQQKRFVFGQ